MPSHEHLQGRLAIPYFNAKGETTGFTFRCIRDHVCNEHNHKKYLQPLAQPNLIYNVAALDDPGSVVHVTEGEIDAIILAESLQEPVVGASGTNKWEPHWVAHFRGWERVLLWVDGDQAGRNTANAWGKRVTCEVVEMPKGQDVNDVYLQLGADGLRKLAGDDEDE